jgi:hypothetical protein
MTDSDVELQPAQRRACPHHAILPHDCQIAPGFHVPRSIDSYQYQATLLDVILHSISLDAKPNHLSLL